MSERPEMRKVEFIESYWTGGEYGSDYKWNDNHGELVRCKDCIHWIPGRITKNDDSIQARCERNGGWWLSDEYCSNAEGR